MPGKQALGIAVVIGGGGQNAPRDVLFVRLWEGFSDFQDGFAPGTYQLSGGNADPQNCATCVAMLGDVTDTGVSMLLHANGGTLTVTEVDKTPVTGRLVGSLSDVTLRQFTAQNGQPVDVEGGCTTSIAGLQFDVPVMAASAE